VLDEFAIQYCRCCGAQEGDCVCERVPEFEDEDPDPNDPLCWDEECPARVARHHARVTSWEAITSA